MSKYFSYVITYLLSLCYLSVQKKVQMGVRNLSDILLLNKLNKWVGIVKIVWTKITINLEILYINFIYLYI